MNPLENEPQWAKIFRGESLEYTRPLLGSELMVDQFNQCFDGLAQCCMGFTYETTLSFEEFCSLARNAWAHLRFRCPNVSASLETIHDPQLRSWVYRPATSVEDVHKWMKASIEVLEEPLSLEDLISRMNQKKLEDLEGNLITRCILFRVLDQPKTFAIFMHGSHTIMDARPTFNAFRLMCEAMAAPSPIEDLPWGTEWKNLPDGPVTATGGPRDNWDVEGVELLQKVSAARAARPVTRSLKPQRLEVTTRGLPVRVRATIDAPESVQLLKEIKATGCTISHLMEAAQALAVCKINPVPEEEVADANVSFPITIISLAKWLTEQYKAKDMFISSLTLIPLRINYTALAAPKPPKEKLIDIMKSLKTQYDSFMNHPHLPHLSAAQMKLTPPRTMGISANPFATTITNLGVVHLADWYPDHDRTKAPLFTVREMRFGHRLTEPNPLTHIWTADSRIFIQVEANDVWDKEYMQQYVDEIRHQAMVLLSSE